MVQYLDDNGFRFSFCDKKFTVLVLGIELTDFYHLLEISEKEITKMKAEIDESSMLRLVIYLRTFLFFFQETILKSF